MRAERRGELNLVSIRALGVGILLLLLAAAFVLAFVAGPWVRDLLVRLADHKPSVWGNPLLYACLFLAYLAFLPAFIWLIL